MSIVTRTGDKGTTALMYGRRVGKNHPRVEVYGCVDELTAAIGLVRAQAAGQPVQEHLLVVQRDLIVLMGELATAKEDLPRYVQDGHRLEITTGTCVAMPCTAMTPRTHITIHAGGHRMDSRNITGAYFEKGRVEDNDHYR